MKTSYLIHLYWEGRPETREQLARRILAMLHILESRADYSSWMCYSMRPVIKTTYKGKKRLSKEYMEEEVIHDVDWIAERLGPYTHQDGEFDARLGYYLRLTASSGLDLSISAGGEGIPKSNPLSSYYNQIVMKLRASDVEELKRPDFKILLMSLVPIWEADRGVVTWTDLLIKFAETRANNRTMPGVWLYERETGEVSFHPELITGRL